MADLQSKHRWAENLHQTAEVALKSINQTLKHSPAAQDRILDLINHLIEKDRGFILYAGAGCNKQVHVKEARGHRAYEGLLWKELLERLLQGLTAEKRARFLASLDRRSGRPGTPPTSIEDLFKVFADRLLVAWLLSSCFEDSERDEAIVRLVEPPPGHRSSPLYDELLKIPFRDIITTNYDTNLKHFLGKDVTEIETAETLARSPRMLGRPRLFYLHGKVNDRGDRLVLDRFDYGRLMAERDGIVEYVTYLLRDFQVIYVGFGLDDPTFNLMESRLEALHGKDRPQSYAFVDFVTEKEREVWRDRRLAIIDYADHNQLPKLFRSINTIRTYVCRSEPNRPRVDDPRDDRSRSYIDSGLTLYAAGDFEGSLGQCRAALSAKLFRPRDVARRPGSAGVMSFGDLAEVCELYIRMALNHYKLSAVHNRIEKEHHQFCFNRTLEGALNTLGEIKDHPESANAMYANATLALDNSIKILQARWVYHEGQFEKARNLYREVASDTTRSAMRGGRETAQSMVWKLKLREGYDYALCQISRIEYQLLDDHGDERLEGRTDRLADLKTLLEGIERSRRFVEKSRRKCKDQPEWLYYQTSLTTIHGIALWTKGRHALRVCRDLIPTRAERTAATWQMLTDGLEFLQEEPWLGWKSRWRSSPRWRALRLRYVCRGHALRWVVAHELPGAQKLNDEDLVQAYAAIRAAIDETGGLGLERQRVASLLEATRLNTLVLFGERIRSGLSSRSPRQSPLSFAAGLHYLDTAFVEMGPGMEHGRGWLKLLGGRLATYLAVVASLQPRVDTQHVKSEELKAFFNLGIERMIERVVNDYHRFGVELGNPLAFQPRMNFFKDCVGLVQEELQLRS
jgi:SIR2-like domain